MAQENKFQWEKLRELAIQGLGAAQKAAGEVSPREQSYQDTRDAAKDSLSQINALLMKLSRSSEHGVIADDDTQHACEVTDEHIESSSSATAAASGAEPRRRL